LIDLRNPHASDLSLANTQLAGAAVYSVAKGIDTGFDGWCHLPHAESLNTVTCWNVN